jgi:hypothetical protein
MSANTSATTRSPVRPSATQGAANNIVPLVLNDVDRPAVQQFRKDIQGVKARIDSMFGKDSEFARVLQSKLDLKGQEAQRAAGLGGGVNLDKMEKMLNALDGLKLSTDHIQAIFLAGFVKGGVEGVLRFIGDGKAEHLQKDGFEKMKQLLESDYKRSVIFVRKQGFFNNLDPVLNKIFGRQGVLDQWQQEIDEEDYQASMNKQSYDSTWNGETESQSWFNIDENGVDRRAISRLNDDRFMGPRRCHDRSWYLAGAITGVSKAPPSSQESRRFQGRSMAELGSIGLQAGDVIYVSKNPGSDPNSMNLNNLPHWGVVIGKTKEGELVISDNWDKKITLSGWIQKYGSTRGVDEVFRNSRA